MNFNNTIPRKQPEQKVRMNSCWILLKKMVLKIEKKLHNFSIVNFFNI